MKKLENRLALVTGSSRGIGQQIAIGLASEGCNVILHGRTKENCQQTLDLLSPYGVQTDTVEGDLSSIEDVHKLIDTVLDKYGYVDILYNNAAISTSPKEIWDFTLEDWNRIFQVNLYSMVLTCNAFAPIMKHRGYGRIINLSSGIKDQPSLAPYSVSKAAVDKFTQDLSVALKGSGVLANYLDPGWIRTDMGGPSAPNDVVSVLPGAIIPALFDNDGPNGQGFNAQELK